MDHPLYRSRACHGSSTTGEYRAEATGCFLVMIDRMPGIIDWCEGLVDTGLLLDAATFLPLEVLGLSLSQVCAVFSRHVPAS